MRLPKSMLWRVSLPYAALAFAFTLIAAALAPDPGSSLFFAAVAAIAIAAAGLSLLLGYLLLHKTSASIASIARSARSLASGDLDQQAQSIAAGETEELASAFNRMAQTIRNTVRDLSGERNKLTAVLDTMADGIVVLDPDGRVSLMNQAAQLLLEVRTTEFLGAPLVESHPRPRNARPGLQLHARPRASPSPA